MFEILDGKRINGKMPDVAIVHLRYKYSTEADWQWRTIKAFAMGHRTIVPVRDPLLSVITAIQIGKHDPKLRVRAFEDLVELATLTKVEFLPVDLPDHREATLERIKPGAKTNWKPSNSIGDCKMKRDYHEGEVEDIPDDTWSYLLSREVILRPMLERIGYRDLLWWS